MKEQDPDEIRDRKKTDEAIEKDEKKGSAPRSLTDAERDYERSYAREVNERRPVWQSIDDRRH